MAAAGLQIYVPMPGGKSYGGEKNVRLAPHASLAGRAGPSGKLAYAARLGLYAHLPRDFSSEMPLGTSVEVAVAAGARLLDDRLLVGPELYGATMLDGDGPFARRSTPLEALLGAHYALARGFTIGAGAGAGMAPATGTPPWRLLLNVSYAIPERQ